MTQKTVSFEVAKALKGAGYPQASEYWYNQDGGICYSLSDLDELGYISRPTYLDAWLWLWREKNIQIVAQPLITTHCYIKAPFYGLPLELTQLFHDAEDAIIAGINHLVENNLIK